MNLERIGLLIKYYRQSAGISQKQLAEKIGTTWEMVSRYETGKSSPLRRILEISDALKTPIAMLFSDGVVGEAKAHYQFNSVPLIEKPFTDIIKAIEETKTYYIAPDWIVRSPGKPFALSSDIVLLNTSHISKNGIIYAIREKPSSSNDIVLIQRGKETAVLQYNAAASVPKILATVIAFERRFR